MRELMRIVRNQRQIEHEGFYHGSQGCEPSKALAEIHNHIEQKMEEASRKATPRIKKLEAEIEDSRRRLPAAKDRLESIQARFGGRLPEIAIPAFLVIVGLFAMLAEAVMLGPFMDLFDISNPLWQRVAAFAIGGACAVVLHMSIESLTPGRFHPNTQRLLRVLGVACICGLIVAGIARGHEAAYGAQLNGCPLAGFLKSVPLLGTMVYGFFTVAFPVAAAIAITFGVKAISEWREYLIAKHDVDKLSTSLAETPKLIECEQKKMEHEQKKLESLKGEWHNSYLVQHERGMTMGASRTPKWMIWLRALIAGLFAYVLCALVFHPLSVYAIVIGIIVFLGAWVHFHHARIHPKPHQLYGQQNVVFRASRNPGDDQ